MWGKTLAGVLAATYVIAAPIAAGTPEDPFGDDWVAIALSPENRNGGYGSSGTPEHAVQIAMDECAARSNGTRCVLGSAIQYGCVAYGIDHRTNAWAGGRGPNEDAAMQEVAAKLPPGFVPDETSGGAACSTPLTPP